MVVSREANSANSPGVLPFAHPSFAKAPSETRERHCHVKIDDSGLARRGLRVGCGCHRVRRASAIDQRVAPEQLLRLFDARAPIAQFHVAPVSVRLA